MASNGRNPFQILFVLVGVLMTGLRYRAFCPAGTLKDGIAFERQGFVPLD